MNVGKALAKKIYFTVDSLSYIEETRQCVTDFVITVDGIKTIVLQLSSSAAGCDELPPVTTKQLANVYAIPLTYLINLTLSQGDYSTELKLAKALPIYKAVGEKQISNYRPISILMPYFSKIMFTRKLFLIKY